MTDNTSELVKELAKQLIFSDKKVTVAESCTGGGIAKALTELPGSSGWFEYGFTTYGNNAKMDLLGVPGDLFREGAPGAVSEEVAIAMASGALKASGADYSVAVTGVAGPDGGTEEKPVGTVWFAWATKNDKTTSACLRFDGDRRQVREQTIDTAIEGLVRLLSAQQA